VIAKPHSREGRFVHALAQAQALLETALMQQVVAEAQTNGRMALAYLSGAIRSTGGRRRASGTRDPAAVRWSTAFCGTWGRSPSRCRRSPARTAMMRRDAMA